MGALRGRSGPGGFIVCSPGEANVCSGRSGVQVCAPSGRAASLSPSEAVPVLCLCARQARSSPLAVRYSQFAGRKAEHSELCPGLCARGPVSAPRTWAAPRPLAGPNKLAQRVWRSPSTRPAQSQSQSQAGPAPPNINQISARPARVSRAGRTSQTWAKIPPAEQAEQKRRRAPAAKRAPRPPQAWACVCPWPGQFGLRAHSQPRQFGPAATSLPSARCRLHPLGPAPSRWPPAAPQPVDSRRRALRLFTSSRAPMMWRRWSVVSTGRWPLATSHAVPQRGGAGKKGIPIPSWRANCAPLTCCALALLLFYTWPSLAVRGPLGMRSRARLVACSPPGSKSEARRSLVGQSPPAPMAMVAH